MSRFTITVDGKGVQRRTLDKLVKTLEGLKGGEVSVSVEEIKPATSRSARLEEALSQIEGAKSEIESLRDELQEWFDNLPENFQSGDKGEQLESAIGELDSLLDGISADDPGIEFPGMY